MKHKSNIEDEAFQLIAEAAAQKQVELFLDGFEQDSPAVTAFLITKLMACCVPNLSYIMGEETAKVMIEDLKGLTEDLYIPDTEDGKSKIITQ